MAEGRGISTATATVVAAICGLLGAVAGAFIKGYYDQVSQVTVEETRIGGALDLERLKFEANLILQAIDTEDQATAVKTLKFFANAGLIPSYEDKVLALAEADEGAAVPALRTPPPPYRSFLELASDSEEARVGRSVGLLLAGGSACTAFLADGLGLLTPDFCVPDDGVPGDLVFRIGFDSADALVQDLEVQSIQRIDGADVVVLGLEQGAGPVLSGLPLARRAPVPDEPVYMVHHPLAGPKQVSSGCRVDAERPLAPAPDLGFGAGERPMLRFSCRSEGGSAGAPVIAVLDGAVLGVHVAGRVGDFELYAIPSSLILEARASAGRAQR